MSLRILIDGSNAAHRFRHTYSELSVPVDDTSELRTGVMYGFVNMILTCIDEYRPDAIVVAWDGEDYWRRSVYHDYKIGRIQKREAATQDEQEAYQQFCTADLPNVKSLLLSLGIPSLHLPRFEADDVIASMVYSDKQKTPRPETLIISTDADFIQLVDTHVRVYNPITHLLTYYDDAFQYITKGIKEVAPSGKTYLLRRAMTGDTSDSIAGIKGIGKKTVQQLITDEWAQDESYAVYREKHRDLWNKSARGQRILESEHIILRNLILMDLRFQHGAVGIPKGLDLHKRVADRLLLYKQYITNGYKQQNGTLIIDSRVRADPSPFLDCFRHKLKFAFANEPTSAAGVKDKFLQLLLRMMTTL